MGMVNVRLRLRMKELTDNEKKTWKEILNPAYEVRGLFFPPSNQSNAATLSGIFINKGEID